MLIDLTHDLQEGIPTWPTVKPFQHPMLADYDQGYRIFSFNQSEGVGTHIDAPAHFIKGGRTISDLLVEELVAPACVIDVCDQVNKNPDHRINADDIHAWEKTHGQIPAKSMVLGYTGWSKYWPDVKQYQNMDANGIMHFPGWSKAAAELLVERDVVAVGIDTLSIDAGIAADFAIHQVILGNDKYQIENLTNLDKLPPKGATVFALPIKIKGGSEAPIRAIAIWG